MNLHAVPCITSFHPPEPDYDDSLRRVAMIRMECLTADTLQDAMDAAGSHHVTLRAVANLLAAAPKDREKAFKALYESVLEDLEKLIEKNGVDEDE